MSPRFPATLALGLTCLAPAASPAATVLKPANSVRWYDEVIGWLDRWTKK